MAANHSETYSADGHALCTAQEAYFVDNDQYADSLSQLGIYTTIPLTFYAMLTNDNYLCFYNYLPVIETNKARVISELKKSDGSTRYFNLTETEFTAYKAWMGTGEGSPPY